VTTIKTYDPATITNISL